MREPCGCEVGPRRASLGGVTGKAKHDVEAKEDIIGVVRLSVCRALRRERLEAGAPPLAPPSCSCEEPRLPTGDRYYKGAALIMKLIFRGVGGKGGFVGVVWISCLISVAEYSCSEGCGEGE
ncbi:hypothetical protein E2C01_028035 [Portunus trituberculatus]|uniref:Uncharacterized protein n=1 Tax=Portunus trituberculatus TaxID=210409 RepID=A0A5B7EN92_PORTR|nr:hypothetical protein [Portunus trituberculatus]